MPKISVIVPAYNCESYISDTLRSIFLQSYEDYEVLVIDSSTDETAKVVSRYGDKIRYFQQPPQGVSAARNFGMKNAVGEYIAFLDGDDIWDPTLLAETVPALDLYPGAILAFTDLRKFGDRASIDDGTPMRKQRLFREWVRRNQANVPGVSYGSLHSVLLWGNVIHTSSVLLRRDAATVIGKFDEQFKVAEDHDYWLRLSLRFPVVYVDRPLVSYRIHDTGLSGPPADRSRLFIPAHLRLLEKHVVQEKRNLTAEDCRIIRQRVAVLRYLSGADSLKRGDSRSAVCEVGKALKINMTVGLEFTKQETNWLQCFLLLLKPYMVWVVSGLAFLVSVLKKDRVRRDNIERTGITNA